MTKMLSRKVVALSRFINIMVLAGSLVAGALASTTAQAEPDDAAQQDLVSAMVDMGPVASLEAVPSVQPAPAPVESVVRYKVHRSPVRDDNIGLNVVKLDSEDEVRIELPGLEVISFNTICRTASGARTACGSRARIQLVNKVARREISCRFLTTPETGAQLQSCEVGGADLGEWLVSNGIGRPTGGSKYSVALREARVAERGMWADAETRNGVILAKN